MGYIIWPDKITYAMNIWVIIQGKQLRVNHEYCMNNAQRKSGIGLFLIPILIKYMIKTKNVQHRNKIAHKETKRNAE